MDVGQHHQVEALASREEVSEIGLDCTDRQALGLGIRSHAAQGHFGVVDRRDLPALSRQPQAIAAFARPEIDRAASSQALDELNQTRIRRLGVQPFRSCIAPVPRRSIRRAQIGR
jgi:hypothetical protein